MRLASKIVCCAAIPVVLLAVTAGQSLQTISQAGDASDEALSQVAPAVQEVASMQESLGTLGRLHGRWIVLQDPSYANAWTQRMAVLEARLAALRSGSRRPPSAGGSRRPSAAWPAIGPSSPPKTACFGR
jgi:hypothetical protein